MSQYLLGLVKAVNFINEQDGLPLAQPELILCLFYHLSDIVDGCTRCGQGDKTSCALSFTFAGDYVSECGLKSNTCKYFNITDILLDFY